VRRPAPWLVAAALAALYLVLAPPTADLAAQTYRTWLFEHAGFTVWDNGWYAGHHVPGYSVLFPPLAALLGPGLVGAPATVVAAWAFDRLAVGARGDAARPAALWFAVATSVSLITGRMTFALGLACGLVALLALARGRLALSALGGTLTALASPVAAVFLALGVAAWGIAGRRRAAAAAVIAAALAPVVALGVAFPEGGDFPFEAAAFWPTLAGTLVVLAAIGGRARTLRIGVALYVVLLVASAVLTTPMGGNAARLGALFAGPVAALALWPDRRRLLLLLAPALLYWQWTTPAHDWARTLGDRSSQPSYYAGLLRFLQTRPGEPFRVEIPFTDLHWETARVAPHVPLARGWERQLDRKLNALFYDGQPLTPHRYRRWLDTNGVRFVALPDAPLDFSAEREAALIRSRPSYLREVWRDAHWRVYAVDRPATLARGARVTALGVDSVTLDVPRPGGVLLRVRWTPYWRLAAGRGCVLPVGDWTALQLRAPGRVEVRTGFAVSRVGARSPRCTD
jgi:hypothetical protein